MALALRAPRDLDIALAALGPRPGVLQSRIANIKDIYLRTRRKFSPPGRTALSRNPQRFPVFPHLFGLY
jgi:hypothetical protein